ncbi:MAG: hypothetical protein MZW92_65205 [Comamonadaceae bacterium]|nr:hypothetical protein [Comamonadaceae bacterium]
MRSVYRAGEVEKRLDQAAAARARDACAPPTNACSRRAPSASRSSPAGLPAMEHLYEEHAQLHRGARRRAAPARAVPRQPRRAGDHADAAAGPAGHRQDALRARGRAPAGHRAWASSAMSSLTAGWVLSGASAASGRARARARSSRRWSTAPTPTR